MKIEIQRERLPTRLQEAETDMLERLDRGTIRQLRLIVLRDVIHCLESSRQGDQDRSVRAQRLGVENVLSGSKSASDDGRDDAPKSGKLLLW